MLLAADYDTGEFTAIAGKPAESNRATESILQVRMQRGALARFGLPVEPERAVGMGECGFSGWRRRTAAGGSTSSGHADRRR